MAETIAEAVSLPHKATTLNWYSVFGNKFVNEYVVVEILEAAIVHTESPTARYSKFHAVSELPATQVMST